MLLISTVVRLFVWTHDRTIDLAFGPLFLCFVSVCVSVFCAFFSFIVMEYLDGGTLRQRLDAAGGGLGFWPAMKHALELASVLRYMHEEAIPGRQVNSASHLTRTTCCYAMSCAEV